jgi:hypothetical protein
MSEDMEAIDSTKCQAQALEGRDKALELETNDHIVASEIAEVLVIVTGGTLSMVHTEMGYDVSKGLAKRLK